MGAGAKSLGSLLRQTGRGRTRQVLQLTRRLIRLDNEGQGQMVWHHSWIKIRLICGQQGRMVVTK